MLTPNSYLLIPNSLPTPNLKGKRPAASYSRMGGSHTTLGDGALDFRVRHGNGYDSASMATGPKTFRPPGIDWEPKGTATHRGAIREEPSRLG